jgi:hypothetical protein
LFVEDVLQRGSNVVAVVVRAVIVAVVVAVGVGVFVVAV